MITLTNLIKDGNLIRTDYYGYDNEVGHIVFDISAGKVVEKTYSKNENENFCHFFAKAVLAIKALIKYNQFPSTYHYVWY